jgi:uncharacterized hydrophobic protein (TIGR00271 family)
MALVDLPLRQLRRALWRDSALGADYLVLSAAACAIASFGLLSNSAAVIIGAMVIAPLMLPLRSLSLAILLGEQRLLLRSLLSLGAGSLVGLGLAFAIGWVAGIPDFGSEVLARTGPTLLDLGVAIAAGGISAFAKLRPRIADTLPGTAIAVALMPPLCVIGITLSQGQWQEAGGALLLYGTNLLGITSAGMLVFRLAGVAPGRHLLRQPAGWLTLGMTLLLVLPLGLSFLRLVQQAQLQRLLQRVVQRETITIGQRARLYGLKLDWNTSPPLATLDLGAEEPPTAAQIREVEALVSRRLGQPMKLSINWLPIRTLGSDAVQPFLGPAPKP